METNPDTDALMLAYVYGELSDGASRSFEEQLATDPDLRAEIEGLVATRDLLQEDLRYGEESGADLPPPHLEDAILRAEALARAPEVRQAMIQVEAPSGERPVNRLMNWLLGGGVVVGATAALLFVVVGPGGQLAKAPEPSSLVTEGLGGLAPTSAAPRRKPQKASARPLAAPPTAAKTTASLPTAYDRGNFDDDLDSKDRRSKRDRKKAKGKAAGDYAFKGDKSARWPAKNSPVEMEPQMGKKNEEASAGFFDAKEAPTRAANAPVETDPNYAEGEAPLDRSGVGRFAGGDEEDGVVLQQASPSAPAFSSNRSRKDAPPLERKAADPLRIQEATDTEEEEAEGFEHGSSSTAVGQSRGLRGAVASTPAPPPSYAQKPASAPPSKTRASGKSMATKSGPPMPSSKAREYFRKAKKKSRARALDSVSEEKQKDRATRQQHLAEERRVQNKLRAAQTMSAGYVSLRMGRASEALNEFQTARALDHRKELGVAPVVGTMRALEQLGRAQQALEYLPVILGAPPKDGARIEGLLVGARCAEQVGDLYQAAALYKRLLKVKKHKKLAQDGLQRIQRKRAEKLAPAAEATEAR